MHYLIFVQNYAKTCVLLSWSYDVWTRYKRITYWTAIWLWHSYDFGITLRWILPLSTGYLFMKTRLTPSIIYISTQQIVINHCHSWGRERPPEFWKQIYQVGIKCYLCVISLVSNSAYTWRNICKWYANKLQTISLIFFFFWMTKWLFQYMWYKKYPVRYVINFMTRCHPPQIVI